MRVEAVIPAFNEESSIAKVVAAIPRHCVNRILVVDNNSTDHTAEMARKAGAEVVFESVRGYGSACWRGASEAAQADIILFLDADFSDNPAEIPLLLQPIEENQADLTIGSRTIGQREKGALPLHALFGNRLACFIIRWLFGYRFTDLGPFRAIRADSLKQLNMQDRGYGWTVEMQVKAVKMGLRCREIPVTYRKRIGRSKISGTIGGSVKAGIRILWTIFHAKFRWENS
ncbi:MAG: glycosyltransferase family 2 protein [Candidatus Omnitrophota bacterium]